MKLGTEPMAIDVHGDGVQRGSGDEVLVHAAEDRTVGTIGGREVVVACAERLRRLRSGYEPRPVDLLDLAVFDRL